MIKPKFNNNYWGRLRQFEVPHSVVQDGTLTLKGSPLAVLLVLFEAGKAQQRRHTKKPNNVDVVIKAETIGTRSGVSKNVVTKAIRELEQQRFIRAESSRSSQGEFGVTQYTLCNPVTGLPFFSPRGTNFLLANQVQYIKLPVPVVRESQAQWALAAMSDSAVRMYVAACWLANRKNQASFGVTVSELKKLSGLSKREMAEQALEELGDRGLAWFWAETLQLRDPYTGEPPDVEEVDPADDPWNYSTTTRNGRAKHWVPLVGDSKDVEELLVECGSEPILQSSGEYKIVCPFHSDQNPSCSVSPKKQCFYCFGCGGKGTLTTLVMRLRGISKSEAIQYLAARAGQSIEFHEPVKNATIYSYYSADGKLIKQVLRYPDKRFSQRRRIGNGWAWDVKGMPPMLYNLNLFKLADVVIVCEGEKDCETITRLNLYPARGGDVVATTSGNAESWSDELADHLKWKRVVLMPDADEPGERYGAAVEASLKSRGIEYRVVSFTDAGAKDVSDFVHLGATSKDLAERIGRDWVLDHEPSAMELAGRNDVTVEP